VYVIINGNRHEVALNRP